VALSRAHRSRPRAHPTRYFTLWLALLHRPDVWRVVVLWVYAKARGGTQGLRPVAMTLESMSPICPDSGSGPCRYFLLDRRARWDTIRSAEQSGPRRLHRPGLEGREEVGRRPAKTRLDYIDLTLTDNYICEHGLERKGNGRYRIYACVAAGKHRTERLRHPMRRDRNHNGRTDHAGGRDGQDDGSDRAGGRGSASSAGASHLFLVRLWHEQVDEGADAAGPCRTQGSAAGAVSPEVWRGKVQHVLSGRAARFDDVQTLVEVLLSLLPGEQTAAADRTTEEPAES
jgi:hypothetical protein